MRYRLVKRGLFSLYTIALAWVLVFLAVEIRPELLDRIDLGFINYFAVRRTAVDYVADQDLVLTYRKPDFVAESELIGDMYKDEYGNEPEPIPYRATYENGFRKNSSAPPYNVAVIGDSYIEIGESDQLTFAELLSHEGGGSVINLGRGWYGPPQYLEVLRRHALQAKPRYALFCFFAGNDFDDMRQYKRWKTEGRYYFYWDINSYSLVSRFGIATKDTILRLGGAARRTLRQLPSLLKSKSNSEIARSELGLIEVEGKLRLKAFNYWERKIAAHEIESLRVILAEFKKLSEANQIVPIVVYIPTSSQVYADLYSEKSNDSFKRRIKATPGNPSLDAIQKLADELNIEVVNLLPVFKSEARNGKLLYYTFDTHWNIEGRKTAAKIVGNFLKDRAFN